MKRILAYTSLALLCLTGCDTTKNVMTKLTPRPSVTHFTDYGFIDRTRNEYNSDPLEMELGDFDGDGDLDIAILTHKGGLVIYENKIRR